MGAEPVKIYDVAGVSVNFLGIPLDAMGGLGDNGGYSVEFEGDAFTDKKGADGSVVRSATHDDRCTVTLILLQTASANLVLSGILNLDRKAPNGAGVGPFLLRDRNGLTIIQASNAWIMGRPKTIPFKGEADNVEWKIRCGDTDELIGGN